jgi:lipopolysaccharide export system protein LptA
MNVKFFPIFRIAFILNVLVFCNFCSFGQAKQAQPKGKKIVCTADLLNSDKTINNGVQTLTGNVRFEHEGAICYADTAYFNEVLNTIDAYGQKLVVHINDSVSLYGKHLQYDGNTKQAFVNQDVRLTNENTVLYTDTLHYDRNLDLGYYNTGGRVESGQSTLTSREAWFYTKINELYFKDSVVLLSPEYTINSDTLKYNTSTEIAYFLGPTFIYSDSNTMYCELGWYETWTDICEFQKEGRLYNKTQCLTADTIWYDKKNDIGIARRSVVMTDTVENILFLSQYAEYQQKKGNAYLTDSAMAIMIEKEDNDSLFLHSDVMYVYFDSNQTVTMIQAYYSVQFFRHNLQGSCDSLVYDAQDSTVTLINSPVMWTEENQFLADTIRGFIQNKQLSEVHFIANASAFADVFEEEKFNQVKGDYMIAYFVDNQMETVFVDGSAECLYYLQEENKDLIGIQKSTSSQMRVFFEENKVRVIRFYEDVKGKVYPEELLNEPLFQDFIWLDQYRPKTKEDIFRPFIYKAPTKTTDNGESDEEEREED